MSTLKLRMKHGCLGYGIYTLLMEMIVSERSHRLTKDYSELSYILHEDADTIRSVVEDFGLFVDMGNYITNDHYHHIIMVRTEVGRKGGKISKRKQTQAKSHFAYPTPKNTPVSIEENKQNTDLLNNKQTSDNSLSVNDFQTEITPVEQSGDKQTQAKSHFAYFAYPTSSQEEKERSKEKEEKQPLKEKPSKEGKKKIPPIENRKAKFYDELIPFVSIYGKDMIRDFYDYWSEENRSRTKMRFEQQTTWQLNLRLKTWAKKDNNYAKPSKQADTLRRQSQIMADIADLDREYLKSQQQTCNSLSDTLGTPASVEPHTPA